MLKTAYALGWPVNTVATKVALSPRCNEPCQGSQVVTRAMSQTASSTVKRGNPVRQPRKENVAGSFYVDHTCIDCDTCRWMDPDTYGRVGDMSAVEHQPETPEQLERAMQALLTCPTFSIHAREQASHREAVLATMPMPVAGCPDVYHCGFSSKDSFGSTAYLIVRSAGNILVDSPRFDRHLLKQIQKLGGAKYHFLTHQDDVAGHDRWHEALATERIIHSTETNSSQGTDEVEVQLEGQGPWQLPGGSQDVELIHTPGHTDGSVVLLFKPGQVLFSGDHFGVSRRAGGKLAVMTTYSSDPRLQARSVEKLQDLDFLHVLPGHGRRAHFKDAEDRKQQIQLCLSRA
ncbi:hypothetical protein ABBQ32_008188 [Trebouxia sp. C0010 RCD-2024]